MHCRRHLSVRKYSIMLVGLLTVRIQRCLNYVKCMILSATAGHSEQSACFRQIAPMIVASSHQLLLSSSVLVYRRAWCIRWTQCVRG
jgi:hypothetical protein